MVHFGDEHNIALLYAVQESYVEQFRMLLEAKGKYNEDEHGKQILSAGHQTAHNLAQCCGTRFQAHNMFHSLQR